MCKTSLKEYLILILKELHSLFDMKNNFFHDARSLN